MKTNFDKIDADIVIDKDMANHGMINGKITIVNKSKLTLHGMINGNVFIQPDSELICHGTINGNIFNDGIFRLFGTLNGRIIETNGESFIDKNAQINEK